MDEFIKKLEENFPNWDISKTDTGIEFHQYTNAGEDFSFDIEGKTKEEIAKGIKDYYEDFDPEEHVKDWIEAKENGVKGVPSIFALVEDSKDLDKDLEDLAIKIWGIANEEIVAKENSKEENEYDQSAIYQVNEKVEDFKEYIKNNQKLIDKFNDEENGMSVSVDEMTNCLVYSNYDEGDIGDRIDCFFGYPSQINTLMQIYMDNADEWQYDENLSDRQNDEYIEEYKNEIRNLWQDLSKANKNNIISLEVSDTMDFQTDLSKINDDLNYIIKRVEDFQKENSKTQGEEM